MASEKKFLEIQQQVKRNTSELQDYMSDLDSWLKEVKTTNNSSISVEKEAKINELPPVRNSLYKKKKKAKKITEVENHNATNKSQQSQRISGYDYRAWDKFDVDKALEEAENDEKIIQKEEEDGETDEEWEDERRQLLAEEEKEKGNQKFKENQFDEAIEHYSDSLRLDPLNSIVYCNRALCQIKRGCFAAAVEDCNSALSLDSNNIKAYFRRGLAFDNLQQKEEALKNFEKCLELDPQNKPAKKEFDKVYAQVNPRGIVRPIVKSLSQQSKQALVRIKIDELLDPHATTPLEITKENKKISSTTNSTNSTIEIKEISSSSTNKKIIEVDEKDKKTTIVNSTTKAQPTSLNNNSAEKKNSIKEEKPPKQTTTTAAATMRVEKEMTFNTSNSTQFLFSLKKIDQIKEKKIRGNFIGQINPNEFGNLFKQNMETDSLLTCIACLIDGLEENCFDGKFVFDCLSALALVPRFKSAWMFVSGKEKKETRLLIDKISLQFNDSSDNVVNLVEIYK